jgi:hypothetical protein
VNRIESELIPKRASCQIDAVTQKKNTASKVSFYEDRNGTETKHFEIFMSNIWLEFFRKWVALGRLEDIVTNHIKKALSLFDKKNNKTMEDKLTHLISDKAGICMSIFSECLDYYTFFFSHLTREKKAELLQQYHVSWFGIDSTADIE